MADHNDPNAVNSIFSDIDVSAADLYDIFGFPSDDTDGGEKVVIALTFASVPQAGVLDPDLLYRVRIAPGRRILRAAKEDQSLEALLKYFEGIKETYLKTLHPSEVRVTIDENEIALTPKEFDLLARLADDAGTVVRREQLIEEVWDEHWWGPTKTLDVHIASLRKKLADPTWIATVRSVGYRLDVAR